MTPNEFMAKVRKVNPLDAKYLRHDVTGDNIPETFCNLYAHDVCAEFGAELPHVIASEQINWLHTIGVKAGWRGVDAVEAKLVADKCGLSLATWFNAHGHSHIAVLVPAMEFDAIHITQAGVTNFILGPLVAGFGSLPVLFFSK